VFIVDSNLSFKLKNHSFADLCLYELFSGLWHEWVDPGQRSWMQMRARVEISRAAALMQLVVENY